MNHNLENINSLLLSIACNCWNEDNRNENNLYYQLNKNISSGERGINNLLDWCRDDFIEYEENDPHYKKLNEVWNACNYYLDYLDKKRDEGWLIDQLEKYFY